MSDIVNANITVNLKEGSFSISGSELFVEKNKEIVFKFIENNKDTNIKKTSIGINTPSVLPIQKEETKQNNNPNPNINDIKKYIESGIYHIDDNDGKISILQKIPGSNKAEKIKNIALLVLYAKNENINGKELIPQCEKHSCYDSKNFATIFKKEKTNFIRKGNGSSWTLELTQPGKKAVVELLEEMVNA